MRFCEYTPADENACLTIFDGNTPPAFAVQERETFQGFLHRLNPPYSYFVIRDSAEKIIACGGIKLERNNRLATLRWDMVARVCQGRHIGTFLTLSRLYLIGHYPDIETVSLHTSQHSYRFYEKTGFVVQRIIPDGILPGMDEYLMALTLDKDRRQELESFAKSAAIPVRQLIPHFE